MTDTPRAAESPSILADAAQMFGLCGFAIAQPLFDLLGDNPAFFVAHDVEGFDVVLFALGLLVIPTLLAFGVLFIARLVSAQVARAVRIVLVGVLVSLTITPVLNRAFGFSTTAWIVTIVLLAVATGLLYARLRHLRTFVTYLSPAPLLFLVVFMFISPVNVLIFGGDPAAAAVELRGTRTNVVVLAFDEFPLGLLLDEAGAIDATRYPGFARLASTSTWYPNATSSAPATHLAVPAIVTGRRPLHKTVPVAAQHPRSLFTLFARSHEMHVLELMHLCSDAICKGREAFSDTPSITSDLEAVYLRQVLPDSTATDWGVASIEGAWGGFNEADSPLPTASDEDAAFDRSKVEVGPREMPERYARFLESLRDRRDAGVWFHHTVLPHTPYLWLPDGRPYNVDGVAAYPFTEWPEDPERFKVELQRLVLQTLYVDSLITQLLDRLEQQRMLDDTMVVITADHGAAFIPGGYIRDVETQAGKDGTLPVPLFVKYPGVDEGAVDERDASTVDVLPTIADTLGVETPPDWKFDGRSLRISDPPPRPIRVLIDNDATKVKTFEKADIDPERVAAYLRDFLYDTGDPHDPYRIGPHGPLVGRPVAELAIGEPTGRIRAEHWPIYDDVDLDGVVPALFAANTTGARTGGWVAIAVNGSIAGVGPVYFDTFTNRDHVVAMLDPSFMKDGRNQIEVFEIDPDGRTLHPLARDD